MPDIFIRVPEGVFDAESRVRIARAVTSVIDALEPEGDGRAAPSWVVIDEVRPGQLLMDGRDMTGALIPVVIHVHQLTSPLDNLVHRETATLIRDICSEALPVGESRSVAPLVLATRVANGWWGGGGHLFRLLPGTAYCPPPPPAFAGPPPSPTLPTASRAAP